MKPLTPAERRDLRAKAHHLDPVVLVGHHGLTPAVLHEIDLALLKHELVKVRISSDDRAVREAAFAQLATDLECAPVQHVGKVLVLWRPNPDKKKKEAPAPAPKRARKSTGPRAPVDPVRERRRGARGDDTLPTSGKGRRGAARHGVPEVPRRGRRARAGRAPQVDVHAQDQAEVVLRQAQSPLRVGKGEGTAPRVREAPREIRGGRDADAGQARRQAACGRRAAAAHADVAHCSRARRRPSARTRACGSRRPFGGAGPVPKHCHHAGGGLPVRRARVALARPTRTR